MKPPQVHCKANDTGAKEKLGCSKMQSLKPGKYISKSSGHANVKSRRPGISSSQLYTENQMPLKGGTIMEAQFCDSKNFSAPQPNHSGKIKLQLFPINEAIQKVLQQEKRNPYLELILAPRKRISSVVQHLNTKWGHSQCARGELMLFPYDAKLDNISGSGKWTHSDFCTAADVHVAVGSPSTFRLRYGWFGPDFEQQSIEPILEPEYSVDQIICDKPLDPVLRDQETVHFSEFPSNFAAPFDVDNAVNIVGNQSEVTPLSWIDCISDTSFGALLSEAAPLQDSKQILSQNITSFSEIPINFDSFDADIASLIGCQRASNQPKMSNPSLWDVEETCQAFPLHNQTSARTFGSAPSHCSAITSSILSTIPEFVTDVDQQCSAEVREEEPSPPHIPLLCNNNVTPDISVPESTGEPELGASCSRLLNSADSLGLSGLLANSLDPWVHFRNSLFSDPFEAQLLC
uniref:TSL-kinase interacting protein 1 n=1 Tax=Oryza brachyantha TaxID=4533 RepID=J3MNB1_ORYBR